MDQDISIIDEKIRDLIKQIWEHKYKTVFSCEGGGNRSHSKHAYISLIEGTGDGWFESNASTFGFKRIENGVCCENQIKREKDEFSKFMESNPSSHAKYNLSKSCKSCGAGIGEIITYRK